MKRKIILPVFIGIWFIVIVSIVHVSGNIHEMFQAGYISSEVASLLDQQMMYGVLGIGAFVSVLLGVWLHFTTQKIVGPIQELTDQVRDVRKSKPVHTLRQYDMEEINTLANAFDKMTEGHYRTLRKIEYEKSKAESVLAHLEDGIVVLDKDGYIIEQNNAAKDYLGIPRTIKKCHIRNILRDASCDSMLTKALEEKQGSSCELAKNNLLFHVRIGLIGEGVNQYGYVMTLTDITKIRQLEAIRYEFVTNVTHELKTPLTSIQGFVETLQNGALENPQVAKKFLDIIDIEAKRLYRLIQDVLLLSEIESMDNICSEDVECEAIVKEVIELLEQQAHEKEIEIILEVKSAFTIEGASRDHIKQVVLNLLSNGVKYTDKGCVKVTLDKINNTSLMIVSDTGIGIPSDHIKHIFERFYRVDRSRSRKSGGTGLGLSIVKHILQLYGWKIEVESEEGKGSTFKIKF